jgi:protein involved in polysaccharide export with SLBB domain
MRRIAIALAALCVQAFSLGAQSSPTPVAAPALRIGDALRVVISREPKLGGDFPIDEAGFVSLPIIGRWRAVPANWPALRDSLLDAYRHELRSEVITVNPLRRVYVLGSVMKPGMFMLDPTVGLQGAIALAGGAGPEGNLDRIRVQRDGARLPVRISLNTTPPVYDVRSGDEIFVERRSWADRNSALLLTSLISIAGIAITLATRK